MTSTARGSRWLPWLISLSLHGTVFALLAFVPTPASWKPHAPHIIDTQVDGDDLHVGLSEPGPERIWKIRVTAPTEPAGMPAAAPVVTMPTVASVQPSTTAHAGGTRTTTNPAGSGTGRGNGTTGGGGSEKTTFFTLPACGLKIVYVIDRSSSMGLNGGLTAVRRELGASLAQLPPDARFQVIFYNRTPQPLSLDGDTLLHQATTENRTRANAWIDSMEAEGGTEHAPALALALSYEPDVIYFLTDADDLRAEQAQQATRMNRGRSIIHAIELTTANLLRLDMPLHQLARDNRGTYHAVALP